MNLRPSTPGDAEPLARLWLESWNSIGLAGRAVHLPELVERASQELADRWEVTLAEQDGRLVGFLALAPAEQRLDQLFVAPAAQGHGIGLRLLGLAKARFPEGFWLRTQAANIRARAFYERQGLVFDRAEPGEFGERIIYVFRP